MTDLLSNHDLATADEYVVSRNIGEHRVSLSLNVFPCGCFRLVAVLRGPATSGRSDVESIEASTVIPSSNMTDAERKFIAEVVSAIRSAWLARQMTEFVPSRAHVRLDS